MPKYIIALMKYLVSSKGFDKARTKIEDIHFNVSGGIIVFLVLIFIGSLFNLVGCKGFNLYLGLAINIITVIAMSSPAKLFKLGIATIVFSENEKESDGEKNVNKKEQATKEENGGEKGQKSEKENEKNDKFSVIEIYGKIISYFLLITSASFLFLGTIPIRYNPGIVPVIILCGVLMLWTDVVWKWKTKTFRRATGTLIFLSILINFIFIVPSSVYAYLFNWKPVDIERMEEINKKLDILDGLTTPENDPVYVDQELSRIINKKKSGHDLSDSEKLFIENVRKSRKGVLLKKAEAGGNEIKNGAKNIGNTLGEGVSSLGSEVGSWFDKKDDTRNNQKLDYQVYSKEQIFTATLGNPVSQEYIRLDDPQREFGIRMDYDKYSYYIKTRSGATYSSKEFAKGNLRITEDFQIYATSKYIILTLVPM